MIVIQNLIFKKEDFIRAKKLDLYLGFFWWYKNSFDYQIFIDLKRCKCWEVLHFDSEEKRDAAFEKLLRDVSENNS